MSKLNRWMRACGVLLLWATTAIALPAQTFTTLHSFDSTDGYEPYAALVQGTDGNLYGTTYGGGANDYGTVFKITPSGTLTTLHSFNSTDGAYPYAALVQGTNGNLYGTTNEGGANGDGTVFKITLSGTLTTLHSFDFTDGAYPYAGLVQATDGNFYGTTYEGGSDAFGEVFKITPSGTLTTLYSFCSQSACADGRNTYAGLVQGTDGNLYGTTYIGGANDLGTVFKITLSGTLTTIYSFCSQGGTNCTDGDYPTAGLVQATDGNLYGTTGYGGANGTFCGGFGCGTVFKITPSGTLTTLYSFCSLSDCTDGDEPYAGLVQATDGSFYGTTPSGGNDQEGTVFKITAGGTRTTLYNFCPLSRCADGAEPYAGLVQDTNGKFYGTTYYGGATGDGTAFSLSVGLGPFVATQPTSGTVGAAVKILGTNLTGATSVTFNGTAATFTVKSKSEITTTVPSGATTGKVKVTTPHGTLKSNVPFRVTP
jgi:uncharacterized repeat protein (TIGR03803 family)